MDYSVGLDIGTGSVGWVAIDNQYRVVKANHKNLMGVRLFTEAQTAADRRSYRTTRRRLSRRKWRLRLLNELFAEELNQIDPAFLKRLKYSWVHPLDETNHHFYYGGAIFGNSKADQKFYQEYPTIYHLRLKLMEDDQKHDLREIYLAIHHLVKYRGHFLTSGQINSDNTFNIEEFAANLSAYNESLYPEGDIFEIKDKAIVSESLLNFKINKTQRVEAALEGFSFKPETKKIALSTVKAILVGVVGNTVDLIRIFNLGQEVPKDEQKSYKFKFSDEDLDDKLDELSSKLSEEKMQFLQGLQQAYDGLTLKMILQDAKSLSQAMVKRYDDHQHDLKILKTRFRNKETKKEFDQAYRNVLNADEKKQIAGKKYFREQIIATIDQRFSDEKDYPEIKQNLDSSKEQRVSQAIAQLTTIVEERLNRLDAEAINDYQLVCLLQQLNLDNFLPTQRNKGNGVIPHQLHENELRRIIEKQGKYYPFLKDTYETEGKLNNKIVGLLTFRVPYYVGPLVEPEKVNGDSSNHWLIRKEPGQITPWNLSRKVNLDESAKEFIHRITNRDTYLIHEESLPKNSLLYQKYVVLQELNNLRYSYKSDSRHRRHRLEVALKQKIYQNLFKAHLTVTKKMIEEYILTNQGIMVEVTNLANKVSFNTALKSYNYLVRTLGRDFVEAKSNQEILEQIIEIQTIFEDRKLIARQLTNLHCLTPKQINVLSHKHFTGWGNLSRKFLTTKKIHTKLKNEVSPHDYSIIDLLYLTSDNLMEIINNPDYQINQWIEQENVEETPKNSVYEAIDELGGSPSVKRGIRQSLRILDDIQRVMGGVAPKRVYLEFARETQTSILTKSRENRLKTLYKNDQIKAEFASIEADLAKETNNRLKDDRLYLYYLQLGKDMYTGDPINLAKISEDYDIDHIVPQSYVKDDSLNNRVLVKRQENARKSDSPLLKPEIIKQMRPFWSYLLNVGLISQKKFDLLNRQSDYSEKEKQHFIARDLVETRQIIKNVAALIDQKFKGETKAVAIRASLTADMRRYTNKLKSREINDYHHAHDALLVATVGEYIQKRGFNDHGDFTYDAFSRYTNNMVKQYRKDKTNSTDESSKDEANQRLNPFSFIVGSMKSPKLIRQTNRDTGEVVWTKENYQYLLERLEDRNLIFTRKTGDSKGMLYKETRFPSRLNNPKTKGKIPFNKKQSVELYGGFDSSQLAYSILIYAQKKYYLLGIRRMWLAKMRQDRNFLEKMVQEISPSAQIILDHIPSEQAIIKEGNWMTIGSATELHNAQQLYLPHHLYNELAIILKAGTRIQAQERLKSETHLSLNEIMVEAYDQITQAIKDYFPKYNNYLKKLGDYREKFLNLDFNDQQKFISDVLTGLHANSTSKSFDFASSFGRFQTKNKIKGREVGCKLEPEDIFVFSSASGIYQRRVKVKNLAKAKLLEN